MAPPKSPTNPLLLILLLPSLSFPAPLSPVTVPPPSAHCPSLVDPNPKKEKNGIHHIDQAQKRAMTEWIERLKHAR